MCAHVCTFKLFIYACLLSITHELAVEKGKGSPERAKLCDIFKKLSQPRVCPHTHFGRWEVQVIPVAE